MSKQWDFAERMDAAVKVNDATTEPLLIDLANEEGVPGWLMARVRAWDVRWCRSGVARLDRDTRAHMKSRATA